MYHLIFLSFVGIVALLAHTHSLTHSLTPHLLRVDGQSREEVLLAALPSWEDLQTSPGGATVPGSYFIDTHPLYYSERNVAHGVSPEFSVGGIPVNIVFISCYLKMLPLH
jgi:hypothetical protein